MQIQKVARTHRTRFGSRDVEKRCHQSYENEPPNLGDLATHAPPVCQPVPVSARTTRVYDDEMSAGHFLSSFIIPGVVLFGLIYLAGRAFAVGMRHERQWERRRDESESNRSPR